MPIPFVEKNYKYLTPKENITQWWSVEQTMQAFSNGFREELRKLSKESNGSYSSVDITPIVKNLVENYSEQYNNLIDDYSSDWKGYCEEIPRFGVNAWDEVSRYDDDDEPLGEIEIDINEENSNLIINLISNSLKECVSRIESSKNYFELFGVDEEIFRKYGGVTERKPEIDKTKNEICIDGDEEGRLSKEAYRFCLDFIQAIDWSDGFPMVEKKKKEFTKTYICAVKLFVAEDICGKYNDFYNQFAHMFNEYVKKRNVCFTKTEKNKWTGKMEKVLVHIRDVFEKISGMDNEIAFELLKASNVSEEELAKGKKVFNINY